MAAHNAAKKEKHRLAENRRRDRIKTAKKSAKMPADVPSHGSVDLTINTDDDTDNEISKPENIQSERVENAQRRRDRAKTDSKKSETEPPPVHLNSDEISKPVVFVSIENGESELEKSDEICDTQSTGSVRGKNNAENTDTDAPEKVNY